MGKVGPAEGRASRREGKQKVGPAVFRYKVKAIFQFANQDCRKMVGSHSLFH